MDIAIVGVMVILALVVGLFVAIVFNKKQLQTALGQAEEESKRVREEARQEADRVVKTAMKETKDEARKRRQQFEEEAKGRRSEISKLENKIKKYLDPLMARGDLWYFKVHGGAYQMAGIPDLLIVKKGTLYAVGLKSLKGKPTKLQLFHLKLLQKVGSVTAVIDNYEDFIALIEGEKYE